MELELFFELIQLSIGTRDTLSRVPQADEWGELYKAARKQTLVGVCFAGIQRLYDSQRGMVESFPETLKKKWITETLMISRNNERLNYRCVELQTQLAKDGFKTYIMKGQGNAALYGDTLCKLRQPGDIDIFLDGGFKRVMAYVNDTFPSNEVNELEIHYHCFKDVEVEIHYKPFIVRDFIRNARLQRFFRSKSKECFENRIGLPNNAGEIVVPTPEFNIVHQLVHIKHHLFSDGIGLRQLMDYCFVLRDARAKLVNTENALKVIHSLGMDCFAKSLMWVLQKVFALESDVLLWQPDEKHGYFLLAEILRKGNFAQMVENKHPHNKMWNFFSINAKAISFACFDSTAWFWTPIWRIWNFCWRKLKGYK